MARDDIIPTLWCGGEVFFVRSPLSVRSKLVSDMNLVHWYITSHRYRLSLTFLFFAWVPEVSLQLKSDCDTDYILGSTSFLCHF